ncbi:MAG: 2-succinyl-5-enolpyruvyl-6-hydroxy-3-cyclohexene-1-carboxylic-acid synthase [Balneolaceae bacterium]|nr:2-succinyl-5-enolpyruvyl-6-hydroxy-3-cyclohexene-1-carboxylic-acid synthase [Balneolaceae bacterium]MDR9408030.1 2-succinyl-5-enolpyruvyl-6-hydroxy-3-cyclohexene-1-carboxylic-acid synthase [Balneolaceae bacterium]
MSDNLTWCSTLLHNLYENGVRHAIISPGSRSTPLTLASAIHPGIQKRVVLDERSAAFIALGIGKSTGMPAVLICTSGTAVANYMPAVVEAKESGVPMILLTADRPPKLRNLGSSQTVDQIKLFGDQTVFFHEAGEPVDDEEDLKRVAYLAKQAVDFSRDIGGAAQINLAFRKPLEPTTESFQKEKQRLEVITVIQDFEPTTNRSEITLDDEVINLLSSSTRPLLISGPSDPRHDLSSQINKMAAHLNAPVLAEPGSQFSDAEHQIKRFDQFIRNPETRSNLQPDLIVRFGDQPYSSSLLWVLEAWNEVPVIHITARRQTQDHAMSVLHKIVCQKHDTINHGDLSPRSSETWMNEWRSLDESVLKLLDEKLKNQTELTDGGIFNYFSDQLSEDWNVILSNSLPARDMLTFGQSRKHQFVNRGAAGIDGVLSTALGIHFSSPNPTCCFIGDLAFLHDSNALYTLQQVSDQAFVVIVINNQGGNIFRMLPIYRKEDRAVPEDIYQTYFQTPQKTDLSHLARASGIDYQNIDSLNALQDIKINDIGGAKIIECVTDAKGSMDLRIDLLKS